MESQISHLTKSIRNNRKSIAHHGNTGLILHQVHQIGKRTFQRWGSRVASRGFNEKPGDGLETQGCVQFLWAGCETPCLRQQALRHMSRATLCLAKSSPVMQGYRPKLVGKSHSGRHKTSVPKDPIFQYCEAGFEPRAIGCQQKPSASKLSANSFLGQYPPWTRAHVTPALPWSSFNHIPRNVTLSHLDQWQHLSLPQKAQASVSISSSQLQTRFLH